MFRPMALTVVFALAGSALVSMTVMPVLASMALRRPGGGRAPGEPRLVRWLKRRYGRILEWALGHARLVLGGAAAVVVVAALLATRLGSEFIPRLNEGTVVINTVRLAEVSLAESLRYGDRIEKVLLAKFPDEVKRVWSRTGTAEVATDPMGLELTDVFVTLRPGGRWTRASTQDFLDKLEPGIWRLEVYPDVLWLRDPFGVTSMSRQVARLFWRQRAIKINLPDVGKEYSLGFLSGPSEGAKPVADSTHVVVPGVYLVWASGADDDRVRQHLKTRASFLEGLYTPDVTPPGIYVVNRSAPCAVVASRPVFRFQIAADRTISNPRLYFRRLGWRGWSESSLPGIEWIRYPPRGQSQGPWSRDHRVSRWRYCGSSAPTRTD